MRLAALSTASLVSKIIIYRIGRSAYEEHRVKKQGLVEERMEKTWLPSADVVVEDASQNDVLLKTSDGVNILFKCVLVNVTKQNKITATLISGRTSSVKGSVKEYFTEDDFTVTLTVILTTGEVERGTFPVGDKRFFMPKNEINQLNEILSSTRSLEVANPYLVDVFGITSLVFKKCEFNRNDPVYINSMPFKIEFLSDMDYKFLVEEI
jgi:hypothetical protein